MSKTLKMIMSSDLAVLLPKKCIKEIMGELYKDQYATVMFKKFFSEKIDTTKVSKNRALFNKLWYNHLVDYFGSREYG